MIDFRKRTVFATVDGSHTKGVNVEESDVDVRGVFAPLPDWYCSPDCDYHTEVFDDFRNLFGPDIPGATVIERAAGKGLEHIGRIDAMMFELRHFIDMACDGNLVIVEFLHADPAFHVITTNLFNIMRGDPILAMTPWVKFRYYAHSLSRIRHLRNHSRNSGTFSRSDFGLPESAALPTATMLGTALTLADRFEAWISDPSLIPAALKNETTLACIVNAWDSLISGSLKMPLGGGHSSEPLGTPLRQLEWDQPAREALADLDDGLVERFIREWHYIIARGDNQWSSKMSGALARSNLLNKALMHETRTLRMSKEILAGGELAIMRPDAQELLDIRNGKWPSERVFGEFDRLNTEITTMHAAGLFPRMSKPSYDDRMSFADRMVDLASRQENIE